MSGERVYTVIQAIGCRCGHTMCHADRLAELGIAPDMPVEDLRGALELWRSVRDAEEFIAEAEATS